MKVTLVASLLTSAVAVAVATAVAPRDDEPVSYEGYKVFRVSTHGRGAQVEEQLAGLNFTRWSQDSLSHVDIVVGPDSVAGFEALGLDYYVMHDDLGASIAGEAAGAAAYSERRRKREAEQGAVDLHESYRRQVEDPSWFDSYHNYEDHIDYFRALQAAFPDNSESISAGRSVQNRNIFGIHLWGANGPGRPAILFHGTVHAREWIVAPTLEYITLQLINGYNSGDNFTTGVLDRYDFYIFPFVNPDGFVYSQTTDRLWRKNRQPAPPQGPANCLGRDINRNWAFGWDANTRGASRDPCSQTYQGEAATDTPENRGLDAYLRRLRDGAGIRLFIDWHSYGQYLLFPFGYAETTYAPELGVWHRTASLMSQVIRQASPLNTTYTFGPSASTLYTTTGSAPDHAYAVGGADWSYTIELPDSGEYGFVLPPSRIRGVAEEAWAGQQALYYLLEETFFDGIGPAQLYQGQI
ncbi:hypothetical protein S40288_07338 [Stachybotrys chartarum IBT 40288]|nr:hypothetical protein S40288_07338 [Stachybotrys chartarum IBT 40288]